MFFSGPEPEPEAAPPPPPPAAALSEEPAPSPGGDDPFWFQSAGDLLSNATPAPRAPEPPPSAGTHPALEPSGLELDWPAPPPAPSPAPGSLALEEPAPGSLALEEPAARTGARPLDPGALDAGFGSAGDGWELSPGGAEPAPAPPAEATPPPGAEVAEPAPEVDVPVAAAPGEVAPAEVPAGGAPRPVAPAPTVPPPAATAPPAEAASPRRRGLRAFMPDSLWLALLVALALGLVLGWRGHLASRLRAAVGRSDAPALEIGGVRGGLYDTSSGAPALVVRGEVLARGAVEAPVAVKVELLEGSRVVASGGALAGAEATPEEVFAATDAERAAALRRALDARAQPGLAAGGRAPFAVVFPPPAPDPHGIELRVTAEPAGPARR